MRGHLETVTNLATMATCLAIVFFLIQIRTSRQPTGAPTSLQKGEQITVLHDVRFSDSEHTLLMAVRKGCHFCEDSLPFYRRLSSATNRAKSHSAQLAVVTSDDPAPAREFLSTNALSVQAVESVSSAQMQALRILGTPTLILTDKKGVVQKVWVGKLSESAEREVVGELGL